MIEEKYTNIEKYLDSRDNVPTIVKDGTEWFYITKQEKDLLSDYLKLVDSIPESEWRSWPEKKIIEWSFRGNNANSIITNSIVY